MNETTLTRLQSLNDGEFHTLCDELLPRISPRFHSLVPHGQNQAGQSIVGQPDSYVGNAAAKCRIAIQYNVKKKSWWTKVIEDVKDARRECPEAEEIVVALPRDVDREKPSKGNGINWHHDAEEAAKPATLTVFNGTMIAKQLDDFYQNLRHAHLGISYSRLSWHALLSGAQRSTNEVVARLALLGRYDSEHYIDREADERVFKMWQRTLRTATDRIGQEKGQRLLPLIADSGIGKTSLLCRFAERSSSHTPVLLVLARDLSFGDSASLVQHVMERLQGLLIDGARSAEEAHLASLLEGKTPLTVVVDGLDEATDASGVRKSIDAWLRSRLGQQSVLIVSSRPEFWRKCRDSTWSKSIVREDDHPHAARTLRHEQRLTDLDPMQGIQLPEKFSKFELSRAWAQSGRSDEELWQLPPDVRAELQHPFTMRSAVDLLASGTPAAELRTRSRIMNLWIHNRLDREAQADPDLRIDPSQFGECLRQISQAVAKTDGSWVPVDNLHDVPRFDRAKPPGAAVERLLAANILETHPEHPNQIRFTFEAVQDFYLAEAIVSEIKQDPASTAKSFISVPFSKVITQLERIGDQIASEECREHFVETLAELDPPRAAVVMRTSITAYSSGCRQKVVSCVARLLSSTFDADRALATELLGRLKCAESSNALEEAFAGTTPSKRLHGLLSSAAISHGITTLVPQVFQTWWFTRENYFVDLRPELNATTNEFRQALTDYALQFIPSTDHSDDYRRAVTVLGYLADDRVVEAIDKRTQLGKWPLFYEASCLLAIGSPLATKVFSVLVDRFIKAKQNKELERKEEEELDFAISAVGCNVGHLATPHIEDLVAELIGSSDPQRQLVGRSLAGRLGSERMLELKIRRWKVDGYFIPEFPGFGKRLGCDKWIELWNQEPPLNERRTLIKVAGDLHDTRIEQILITSLNDREVAGIATQSLAAMGSERSCAAIRGLLSDQSEQDQDSKRIRECAYAALATLRDPCSVPEMVRFLESDVGAKHYDGTVELAAIGTNEAEDALLDLKNQTDESLVTGLVSFGSRRSVAHAVEIARRHTDGPNWLLKNCRFCFQSFHGWSRHKFRTDVDLEPLLDFVRSSPSLITEETYDCLLTVFNSINGPIMRQWLHEWYDRRNSATDIKLKSPENATISGMAFHDLAERGDSYVLSDFLQREIEAGKKFRVSWIVDKLGVFNTQDVQLVVREALERTSDPDARVVVLDLLGHVGADSDVRLAEAYVNDPHQAVASAAYEAKLRLSDPMRLAEGW